MIIALVLLGQVLELRTCSRTGSAIRELLNLAPPTARLVLLDSVRFQPKLTAMTGSGAAMAPMWEPELKMPVASTRSFFGNHSATVLISRLWFRHLRIKPLPEAAACGGVKAGRSLPGSGRGGSGRQWSLGEE